MTREEEIKQAASVICEDKAFPYERGFITGAQWADEHPAAPACNVLNCPSRNGELIRTDNSQVIANLQAEIITLKIDLSSACDQLKMDAENIQKLRNPWISVEDRLPKKTRELELLDDEHDKVVIVCRRFGEAVTAYLDAEEIWRLYPTGRPFYGEITHWMPIPELPKGGEK